MTSSRDDAPSLRRLETPLVAGPWKLHPVQAADVPLLYNWIMHPDVCHRWTTRGLVVPFETFERRVWEDVLASFFVSRTGAPVAWVTLTSADLHSGHCSGSVVVRPSLIGSGVGYRAALLVVRYGFAVYPFRKIYFESVEYAAAEYASAFPSLLRVEAVLEEHLYFDGRYWPRIISSITRSRWDEVGRPLFGRLFRDQFGELTGARDQDG